MLNQRRPWPAAVAVGSAHFALQWLLTGLLVGLSSLEQRGVFDVPAGWRASAALRDALDLLNFPFWIASDRPANLALLYAVNSVLWGLIGAGLLTATRAWRAARSAPG